jgi:very-short-patch-repair endonuclease
MEKLFTSKVTQSLLQSLADGEISIFFSEADDIRDLLNELFAEIESVSQVFLIDKVNNSKYYKNITFELYRQFIDMEAKEIRTRLNYLTRVLTIFPNQELTSNDFIGQIRKLEVFFKNLSNLKSEKDSLVEKFPSELNFDHVDLLEKQIKSYQCFYSIFKGKITERNRRILTSKECYEKIYEQVLVIYNFYKLQKNRDLWERLQDNFPLNETVSSGIVLSKSAIQKLAQWLHTRVSDVHLLNDWIRYKNLTDQLKDAGLSYFVDEMEEGTIKSDRLEKAFLSRFYSDWLQAIYDQLPVLRDFNIEDHSRYIDKFREYDEKSYREANQRLRSHLLNSRHLYEDPSLNSEIIILKEQSKRSRKLMSIRQLFSKIHRLILKLKPCVMMSPLTVSTYLQDVKEKFDIVIFDEASQILPHEAITVIYRGNQVIIAGDEHQLPPTTFFAKLGNENETDDDDDESENDGDNIGNYKSILDLFATKFSRKRLRWHYRSRSESLIAFSNKNFYENELVTFPSTKDEKNNPAITFELVPNGCWKSGSGGGFNPIEAARTAELVMQFFRNPQYEKNSLGVITLNQRHSVAVQDELEKLRRKYPEMEVFFGDNSEGGDRKPFFVKNLENVQGDERDYIFLCIGYGKDATGQFYRRFGPLNQQGGERRLNVAITRAKEGITVISSIHYSDISISPATNPGPKLLREYLEFAETGNLEVSSPTGGEAESPFEKEVAEALKKEGFDVHHQIGCSGYRIDMALTDKEAPGRFVLGVECDGASYHSSATARDRDRLRQRHLEGLGWKIHRIWSTDWIKNPERQIEKVKEAFESAKKSQENENAKGFQKN